MAQTTAARPEVQEKAFDPLAAWDEFETLLRARYAYVDRSDFDVGRLFAQARSAAARANDRAILRTILRQTAFAFTDPHLVVGPLGANDYPVIMTSADLDVGFKSGRLLVKDVRQASPAFRAGIRPGDEVVEVDGLPALRAARLPFGSLVPNPTAKQLDYGAILAVNGKRSGERTLRLRRGKRAARTVALQSATEFARSLAGRPLVSARFIGPNGDVAVLRPANSLGNNDTIAAFDRAVAQVANARAVVLDMRDTPSGGNTEVGRSIIGHFVPDVRPYQLHRVPSLEREFSVPRQFVEYVFPRAPRFAGPVFVVHGRWTGSMGEGIVIGMDAAAGGTTVGSDMGDLLGGLYNFDLAKSGARVDLGAESLFHIDGTPREDFVADHALASADTAPDGSDPALAKVLELLGEAAK